MNSKRRHRLTKNQSFVMPAKTRDFLQKICYKKTASVDMTNYGFISDSKVNPVNLLMKPLREKIENICGSSRDSSDKEKPIIGKKKEKIGSVKPGHAFDEVKFKSQMAQYKTPVEPKKIQVMGPSKRKVHYEDQQRSKIKKLF